MKPIVVAAALGLGACTALQSPDPASPHYAYGAGWQVEIVRPLTIPAGAASVRLQAGRVVARNSVQEHAPFCVVEVETVGDAPQVLASGRVAVARVMRHIDPIAVAAPMPRWSARADDGGGDPSFLYYITEFRLRDAARPELRSVRCAWNQMAPGHRALMRHLTLAEMRDALGDWVALVPPGGAP